MKRRVRSLLFAGAAIVCGLVWRLAPLGLPPFLFKYGGSVLYAVMIYWLLAAVWPRLRVVLLAVVALVAVSAIEAFKLVHLPGLDAFRLTLAGKLLLGRFFSGWDLVAYAVGIVVVGALDAVAGPTHREKPR